LNHRGNLHAVPASLKGKYVIRFTVTSTHTSNDDLIKDWNEIRLVASEICEECKDKMEKRVPLKGKIYFLFVLFLLAFTKHNNLDDTLIFINSKETHIKRNHFRDKNLILWRQYFISCRLQQREKCYVFL
jgi:hypothetical protein